MQVVELDVDVDADFFCPVTGHQILAPEDYSPSPATAFCLPPDADDFCDMKPNLRKIWSAVRESSGKSKPAPWELWSEFCKALDQQRSLVVFALTSHGMTCGPVCSTVYLCIDFAYISQSHNEHGDE